MPSRLSPAAASTPMPEAGREPEHPAASAPPLDCTEMGHFLADLEGLGITAAGDLGPMAGLAPPFCLSGLGHTRPARPAREYDSLLAFLHDHRLALNLDPARVRDTVDSLHQLALGSPDSLSSALRNLQGPLRLVAMAQGAGPTSETLLHRVLRGPDPVAGVAALAPYRPFVDMVDDEAVAPLHLAIGWGERIPSAIAKAAYVRNARDWLDLKVPNSTAATHINNLDAAHSFLARAGQDVEQAAVRQLRIRQARPSRARRVQAVLGLGADCRLRVPFCLTPPPAARAVANLLAPSPAGQFSPLSMAVLAADPPAVDLLLAALDRDRQPRVFDAQVFGCDAVMADLARKVGSGDLGERVARVHQALFRPFLRDMGDHRDAVADLASHLARSKDLPALKEVVDEIGRLPASDAHWVVNRSVGSKPALLASALAHCPDLAVIEQLIALGADLLAPVLEPSNVVEAAPLHLVAGLRGEVGMHLVIMQCPAFRQTLASSAGEGSAKWLAGVVRMLKKVRPVAANLLRVLVQAGANPQAPMTFYADRLIEAFVGRTSCPLAYPGPERVRVSPLEACAATRSYEATRYLLSLPAVRSDGGAVEAAHNAARVCGDEAMAASLAPWLPAAGGAASRRPGRGGRAAGR